MNIFLLSRFTTILYFRFQDFTGEDMLELKYMFHTAPDFYYSSLKENMKLSLLQILRFTKILKEF